MGILRDFMCSEHGIFESWDGICKQCGVKGDRVYTGSAPAFIGSRTKNIDKTLQGLAKDFQMTDIKSTREGEFQSGYLSRNNKTLNREETAMVQAHAEKQQAQRPGDGAIWGGGFQGLNMGNVLSGKAVQSIKGEAVGVSPQQAGISRGPVADPKATFKDHENLSIKK